MRLKQYVIVTVIGAVISFVVAFATGIFNSQDLARTYRILCNSFFVTSVLLIGFGLFSAISTTGFFNIFGFTAKVFGSLFIPGRYKEKKAFDYFEYIQSKDNEKRAKWHCCIVGAFFLVVSMVFLVLENRVYGL